MQHPASGPRVEDTLRHVLGPAADVSRVLTWAREREPLLIDGPLGSEHMRLARILHEASGSIAPLLSVAESLEFPSGASVFIDLTGTRYKAKISMRLVERLGTATPIVATSNLRSFWATFEDTVFPRLIRIPPLSARRADIPHLLIAAMREHGFTVGLRSVGMANLVELRDYAWPENLAELRECARRLGALITSPSDTAAARKLGISRQAFRKYLSLRRLRRPPALE